MADIRNPNPTPETAEPRTDLRTTGEKPPKAHTLTPSNVPMTAGSASSDGPSTEAISRRAYELFQRRGGQHGYHVEDWFEAERQLREERQPTSDGAASGTKAKKSTATKASAKKSTAKKSTAKKSAAKKAGGEG